MVAYKLAWVGHRQAFWVWVHYRLVWVWELAYKCLVWEHHMLHWLRLIGNSVLLVGCMMAWLVGCKLVLFAMSPLGVVDKYELEDVQHRLYEELVLEWGVVVCTQAFLACKWVWVCRWV